MGYTTKFFGELNLDKPLTQEQIAYLKKFASTRRMKRMVKKVKTRPDPVRDAVGLPIGTEGEFFVGAGEYFGQEHSDDILDYNCPPKTQPGLWCHWTPTINGDGLEWDGGEKFYHYVDWMKYIIENFLKPWGYVSNGSIDWQGEDRDDIGCICVENNELEVLRGRVVYE